MAFVLGAWIYPMYKAQVRIPHLDRVAPGLARVFDIKEHLVALALSLSLLGAWMTGERAPPTGRGPRWLTLVAAVGAAAPLGGWLAARTRPGPPLAALWSLAAVALTAGAYALANWP